MCGSFALSLSLLFVDTWHLLQLVDDCLDFSATSEALGKPSGADLADGIVTLPVLYALQDSKQLYKLWQREFSRDGDVEEVRLVHSLKRTVSSPNVLLPGCTPCFGARWSGQMPRIGGTAHTAGTGGSAEVSNGACPRRTREPGWASCGAQLLVASGSALCLSTVIFSCN